MTLSIISGLLAIPLITIASFGEVDALGPWDVGEFECTLDHGHRELLDGRLCRADSEQRPLVSNFTTVAIVKL